MKATLEVQKAVFLHKVGTLIVQSLHADCTKLAHILQFIQQLVSIQIKFKLSSSQEPAKCLFFLIEQLLQIHIAYVTLSDHLAKIEKGF